MSGVVTDRWSFYEDNLGPWRRVEPLDRDLFVERWTVGSSPDADVRITGVEAFHCELGRDQDDVMFVRDLGSRYGTWTRTPKADGWFWDLVQGWWLLSPRHELVLRTSRFHAHDVVVPWDPWPPKEEIK